MQLSCKVVIEVVFIIVVIAKISCSHGFLHRNLKSRLAASLNVSSLASFAIVLITIDLVFLVFIPTVLLQLVMIVVEFNSLIVLKAGVSWLQLVLDEVFIHLLLVLLQLVLAALIEISILIVKLVESVSIWLHITPAIIVFLLNLSDWPCHILNERRGLWLGLLLEHTLFRQERLPFHLSFLLIVTHI